MSMSLDDNDLMEILRHMRKEIINSGGCRNITMIAIIDKGNGEFAMVNDIPGEMLEQTAKAITYLAKLFQEKPILDGGDYMAINVNAIVEKIMNGQSGEIPKANMELSDDVTMSIAKEFKTNLITDKEENGLDYAKNKLIVSAIEFSKKMVKDYGYMNIPQRVEWIGTMISESKEKWQKYLPGDDFSWWPDISDKDIQLAVEHT